LGERTETDDESILGIENRNALFINALASLKDSYGRTTRIPTRCKMSLVQSLDTDRQWDDQEVVEDLEQVRCIPLLVAVSRANAGVQRTSSRSSVGNSIRGNRPLVPMRRETEGSMLMAFTRSTRS
jgi:hypothetical protein